MTTRRPKTVLTVSILILAAVLALFAVALSRANSDDREDAERRFQERASVAAALTESIFASTSVTTAAEIAKELGTPVPQQALIDQRVREGNLLFGLVLDRSGNVLGASSGAAEAAVRAAAEDPSVKRALDGAQYSLSDYVQGAGSDTLLYSLSFKGASGGNRVWVSGFPARILSDFLGAYLARIPDAEKARAYILDSRAHVIGSPVRDQRPGATVNEPGVVQALRGAPLEKYESRGSERVLAAQGVANSTWRVVLTQSTADLYADINTTVEWLILVALAIAGMAAVALLNRATRAAAEAQTANARLSIANDELAQSNIELQRSNSELEQFASVASHDLQEPLRKVQTFGDQLERRFGESIPDEGLDYLRRMRAAAGRMSILIDDLLRFSRVTTRALPPEPVSLARIAREVTSDLETVLEETRGSVEVADLPTVEADPLQMRQLMQNLIGNAIKFHRPGVAPLVRVSAAAPPRPDAVAFSVTDNGIGIEPEYRERIFRVFERLHPRDVYAGTGIGLALCRKIVERHGGTISVEDGPDGGTRFTVVLPAVQSGRRNGSGQTDADIERERVTINA